MLVLAARFSRDLGQRCAAIVLAIACAACNVWLGIDDYAIAQPKPDAGVGCDTHADCRRGMTEQGQHRTPYYRLIVDSCRDQVGRPDRQPQRVAHNAAHHSRHTWLSRVDTPVFGKHCQPVGLHRIAGAQNSVLWW